jgi:hypothetical protein
MLTMLFKVLACELVALAAPLVCLVYRGGWFNTPDDPASPHGQYEPKMQRILARFGVLVNDWWWLGVRNRAYGLRYALKPAHFKRLTSYEVCRLERRFYGLLRITRVDGYAELALNCWWVHVIVGYRVTPIYNEAIENAARRVEGAPLIPFRAVNMDARPLISIRSGMPD